MEYTVGIFSHMMDKAKKETNLQMWNIQEGYVHNERLQWYVFVEANNEQEAIIEAQKRYIKEKMEEAA